MLVYLLVYSGSGFLLALHASFLLKGCKARKLIIWIAGTEICTRICQEYTSSSMLVYFLTSRRQTRVYQFTTSLLLGLFRMEAGLKKLVYAAAFDAEVAPADAGTHQRPPSLGIRLRILHPRAQNAWKHEGRLRALGHIVFPDVLTLQPLSTTLF